MPFLAFFAMLSLLLPAPSMAKPRKVRRKMSPAYVLPGVNYRVVYDGGRAPGQQTVGQYADPNTNTIHSTRGFSRRAIAQDVGQLVFYNLFNTRDQKYFGRILGMPRAPLLNQAGYDPNTGTGPGGAPVSEAFADYYSILATGGMPANQSITMGNVSIDPRTLRRMGRILRRVTAKRGYQPLRLHG